MHIRIFPAVNICFIHCLTLIWQFFPAIVTIPMKFVTNSHSFLRPWFLLISCRSKFVECESRSNFSAQFYVQRIWSMHQQPNAKQMIAIIKAHQNGWWHYSWWFSYISIFNTVSLLKLLSAEFALWWRYISDVASQRKQTIII